MKVLISALLVTVLTVPALALTRASRNTDGGLTLRASVSDGTVVDPGDAMSFTFQSAHPSGVVVFDIDTQGYVTLLTDEPVTVRAHDTQALPDDGSQLFAEGQPGVEFVFAIAADDPGAFDTDAIASLRDGSRRINGDPFVAANMIAAELVRNISQENVFMGYTYFYVTNRVDYPGYLCGNGDDGTNDCAGYRVEQNFDRSISLAYPLARGYDLMDMADETPSIGDSGGESVAMPEKQDAVNFYPYGSEIHYADPIAVNAWYNWGWYDPYLWYYPYSYPYCGYPYSGFSIGIGWGWGWGGYYCGGYYNPYWGCGYYPGYGYPSYPVYSGNVVKFKSQYKANNTAGTLAQNRTYAMKRDASLRIASKGTRTSSTPVSYRSRTVKGGYPALESRHVKTSVSGSRYVARNAWAQGRGKGYSGATPYRSRNPGVYHNNGTVGRTVIERGSYKASRAAYGEGSARTRSGSYSSGHRTPYRSHGTWTPSTRGYGASQARTQAYRGWSGGKWGGGYGVGATRGGSGLGHGKGR